MKTVSFDEWLHLDERARLAIHRSWRVNRDEGRSLAEEARTRFAFEVVKRLPSDAGEGRIHGEPGWYANSTRAERFESVTV